MMRIEGLVAVALAVSEGLVAIEMIYMMSTVIAVILKQEGAPSALSRAQALYMNEGVLGCFGQDLNRMTIVSGTARSRRTSKGRSRCQRSKEGGATRWGSGLKETAEAKER